jgi:hypothetical protein
VNNLRTTRIRQWNRTVRFIETKNYSPDFCRKFRAVKKFAFEESNNLRKKTEKATPSDGLLIFQKTCAQVAGLDFAVFLIFAAVFLRLR